MPRNRNTQKYAEIPRKRGPSIFKIPAEKGRKRPKNPPKKAEKGRGPLRVLLGVFCWAYFVGRILLGVFFAQNLKRKI
jgi:hypothetical protein